jgi:hypothetical protein
VLNYTGDCRIDLIYRLWSIEDKYPAMLRAQTDGVGVGIEIVLRDVNDARVLMVLQQEPPGLVIGRVKLAAGSEDFGVLTEPHVLEG